VSGSRLFTISPRYSSLRESPGSLPAQEVLRFFSDATLAGRFAFDE